MDRMPSLADAEKCLGREITTVIERVRIELAGEPRDLEDGLFRLRRLRKSVFEDINQIQHEGLILAAARWIQEKHRFPTGAVWEWNPRAGGAADEPDLRVLVGGRTVISAEATASEEPKGILDSRMRETLAKLAAMEGQKYYFVRTEPMATRASSKIRRNGHNIEVVQLPLDQQ